MPRILTLTALFVALLQIGTPAATPSASPTPEPVHERCIVAPAATVAWIGEGLYEDDGTSLRNAWAVKSDDFKNVWFVAADLEGPGLEDDDEIALWATDAIEEDGTADPIGGGLVVSVNNVAEAFSDWFPASDYDVSGGDDGAEEAIECADGED